LATLYTPKDGSDRQIRPADQSIRVEIEQFTHRRNEWGSVPSCEETVKSIVVIVSVGFGPLMRGGVRAMKHVRDCLGFFKGERDASLV
jgi:hypothetical protein